MDEEPTTDDFELETVTTRLELASYLRRLYARADRPSLRELELASKHSKQVLYRSTVSDMLAGKRFPRRAVCLAFVQSCGVRVDRIPPWHRAWERAAESEMNGQLTAHFESMRTPATPAASPDREIISIAERRASEIIWEAELRAEQIINHAKNSVRNEDADASPPPESRSHQEPRLSEADVTLLREIATGRTADQVAHRLDLSARTLRRRLRNVCDQLEVNTPIEAVTWAARQNLI